MPDLMAICDLCLTSIDDGQGHVWIDQDALSKGEGETEWHTTHDACQAMPAGTYAIAVERIRTWKHYLHWSVHLMSKSWLADTDWQEFVLGALEIRRARVSGLRPVDPDSITFRGIGIEDDGR